MRSLLFTLICLLLLQPSFAQLQGKERIDSLMTALEKAGEDTSKVMTFNALAYELRNRDPEQCIRYADSALALSKKLNFKVGAGAAHIAIGTAIMNFGQFDEALAHFDTAKTDLIDSDNKQRESLLYNNIGIAYQNKGDFIESLIHHNKALKLRREIDFKLGISASLNNIGIIHTNMGNYQEAIKCLFEALKIREESGDRQGCAGIYTSISSTYGYQNNFAENEKYLRKALEIYEEIGDNQGLSHTLNNLGNIYMEKGKIPEAQEAYKKSLALSEALGNPYVIATVKNNIGAVYRELGNFPEALKCYRESVDLRKEIQDLDGLTKSLIDLGELYTAMKLYPDARRQLAEASGFLSQLETKDNYVEYYLALTGLDSATGNYQSAFLNYKSARSYLDSLQNTENTRKMVQANMLYEFEKKEAASQAEQEKKNAIAREEIKRQRNIRNSSLAGVAALLIFSFIVIRQRNRVKKEKKRSDELLLNILPGEVAEELKAKGSADAKQYDDVTVMFTDFKNFTQISEKMAAHELVAEIHACFKVFDDIIGRYNIEKIKTIGDSYMCAGGLPVANTTNATDVVKAALEIRDFMLNEKKKREAAGVTFFEIRIGIHTGPVVAGIVGVKKFAYDIWGDTVNIASRMESAGEAGKVNVSGATHELIKDKFECVHRGKVEAKNKGQIDMYFVNK